MRKVKHRLSSRGRRKLTEALFLVPTVFTFIMVIVVPFFMGIWYSFTKWDGISTQADFIGLNNYRVIFTEPAFLHSFLVTAAYTILNVFMVNLVAFFLSLLVTNDRLAGRNFYRAGFFVPNLIGGIVLGTVWQFVFINILPMLFKNLGMLLLSKSFISDRNTVIPAIAAVSTWQYAGYIMTIYVAAIQGIPRSVIEASQVDGANGWQRVLRIQTPLMANAFTISLFLTLTNSFKMYDINVALTNGGPAGVFMNKAINTSEFLAMNIYNTSFKYSKMGQGQAKAVVFFVVLVIVSVIQVGFSKRKEVEM